jgi:thiol:disulfide interchange protein
MLFSDSTLQIFLTIYHGSLIGTFFFDYIIRNAVRIFIDGPVWQHVSNVAMGVLFIAVIIWMILSVWSKAKRNLQISLIVLIIIFIIRLAVGIPDTLEKRRHMAKNQYSEELVVFIAQVAVHLFGVVATFLLAKHS